MKKLIEKTDILLEALPYFQEFRRRTFVIKVGGAAMEKDAMVTSILKDIVFLEQVGIRVIVVHGGGKAINAAAEIQRMVRETRRGLQAERQGEDGRAYRGYEAAPPIRAHHCGYSQAGTAKQG